MSRRIAAGCLELFLDIVLGSAQIIGLGVLVLYCVILEIRDRYFAETSVP